MIMMKRGRERGRETHVWIPRKKPLNMMVGPFLRDYTLSLLSRFSSLSLSSIFFSLSLQRGSLSLYLLPLNLTWNFPLLVQKVIHEKSKQTFPWYNPPLVLLKIIMKPEHSRWSFSNWFTNGDGEINVSREREREMHLVMESLGFFKTKSKSLKERNRIWPSILPRKIEVGILYQ